MSNHHLRNKELSLKAKGLLSQMLSLPEDWDYTLAGLSYINRESIDAIRTAVWELEKAGYITRRQGRDEKGKMTAIEYTIYEQPQPPALDCPVLENPTADNPILENPTPDNPTSENPMQLNKDIQKTNLSKKEKSNTDLSNNHSIPILSPNPSPLREETAEPEWKGTEAADAYSVYEEIIKDNIEYEHFIKHTDIDRERLDEIVSLILETVCTKRKTIRIAGDDYPAELVKAKFMKLNSSHIEFVFDCMKENTTKIRNIKQYLKAVLFNAPNTIDSYYTALVNHDMYGGYNLKSDIYKGGIFMAQSILIVDDEKEIVSMLYCYFSKLGYTVYTATAGNAALKEVEKKPDIILLDVNMPDIDGFTVCERIRDYVSCPIIFLTARIEDSDKIKGFSIGADDYVIKPFSVDELEARIAAHLRREKRHNTSSKVQFDEDMVIDYSSRIVFYHNKDMAFTKKEFDIISFLSQNKGIVFDRETIYEKVWGLDGIGDNTVVTEHIRRIRAKFLSLGDRPYIETVWGCGYKWKN